ncbi:glycoside hydrolase family 20 zincin-like fold domain-containing protein [Muricauda sp. ANG21]|uniref:glycoside hydrolase family 20 zincin-like fold domain-containing protein n=1 Tax=Allomuricauda sp. ANG21 TaxID=3042468 RepID=UPI00345582C7
MKGFKYEKVVFTCFFEKNVLEKGKSTQEKGILMFNPFFIYFFTFLLVCTETHANDLRARGYSLIPAPQEVLISDKNIGIDDSWGIETSMNSNSISVKRLLDGVKEFHDLVFRGSGTGKIVLELAEHSLFVELDAEQSREAYQIEIKQDLVKVIANSETGIFYGIQSLLQLLKPGTNGEYNLPIGVIKDWPDTKLRVIHWDTKHHQDRIETLKRYLDWAAFFKVNAVAFEIEDKYEYPRNPIIGAPGAFTKKEMIEITSYALERFIQLIPVVQAPSHMAFVLKHKEYEHLRADAESNYHICMCDEEAMELVFDMYQDMIDATPGVEYFFVSTDEVYYPGICGKCEREYNEENRSWTWVDYVNRVHNWMSDRDRKMLAWVEYPLLTDHIAHLPSGIIDAIMTPTRSEEWIENENRAGIEHLSYSSMQGAEFLFPNYFPTRYRGRNIGGRLQDVHDNISKIQKKGGQPIGTFAAAWDDSGLHNETFWLGWATVTQYGWSIEKPTIDQSITDFMNAFYGYGSPYMVEIYGLLQEGARFYEDLWEKVPSKERGNSYGSSKGKNPHPRSDLTLKLPSLPFSEHTNGSSLFDSKYSDKIMRASEQVEKNDRLINLLSYSITKVDRNWYNLEVLLSIAYLERYTMDVLINLVRVEKYVNAANKETSPQKAMNYMIEAYETIDDILDEEKKMWDSFVSIWEKSQYKKGRSVDGKDYVHVMDDVKDHFADRRKGLDYMLAPLQRMEMKQWRNQLWTIIRDYSKENDVKITGIPEVRLED